MRQQPDVESQVTRDLVITLFAPRQEIDEQRRQTRALEYLRHVPVSRTVAAATAAVSKQDRAPGVARLREIAFQALVLGNRNDDSSFVGHHALPVRCSARRPQ